MKAKRVVKWSLGLVLFAGLAGGGILYLLANSTPSDYRPITLTEAEKVVVRQEMNEKLSTIFRVDKAGTDGLENFKSEDVVVVDQATGRKRVMVKSTFEAPLTDKEMNKWIGSMEKATTERLANSGISQPAISINDGSVRFYAHVDKYDKVVGLDLNFRFNDDDSVVVDLEASRVGDLPIPEKAMEQYKSRLVSHAGGNLDKVGQEAKKLVGGEAGDIAAAVATSLGPKLGAALAGRPVTLDIDQGDGEVRIRGIRSVNGKLVLDVVSLQAKEDARTRGAAQVADAAE